MIIGVSGKIGSGKDTFASVMKELQPEYKWDVRKVAGKLKEVASLITGVPINMWEDQEFKNSPMVGEWGMTHREFLQRLGTDGFRNNVHPDIWVKSLFSEYIMKTKAWNDDCCASYNEFPNWIVTDIRFPNEAEAIRERGYPLIKIVRDVSHDHHISETALDGYRRWDFVIDNNGSIDHFVSQVKVFAERIGPFVKPEYMLIRPLRGK